MSLKKVLNTEFDILIGERVFPVKALSVLQLLDLFNSLQSKEAFKNAQELAKGIEDPGERNKFLIGVWADIPKINDISEISTDIFTPLNILKIIRYTIIKNNKDVTEQELEDLMDEYIDNSNLESYVNWALECIGIDPDAIKEDKTTKKPTKTSTKTDKTTKKK
jgi:hypothetical protein